MTPGERVAAAAQGLVGARFRAQGRDPSFGLDCVGVAASALTRAGATGRLPRDHGLHAGAIPPGAVPADMIACAGDAAGDILLCRVAATQVHVAVRTCHGFVHADVQARRVVERDGAPPWPVEAAWRWIPQWR